MPNPDQMNAPTDPDALRPGGQEELPLDAIAAHPVLARCLAVWRDQVAAGALPAGLDTDLLPPEVFPYTMLLDYLPDQSDVRVRVVGTYIGERAVFAAEGRTLRGFFQPADATLIYRSMEKVARTREPGLARRAYVSIAGARLSYVRLILPLSIDGGATVTGFFKTIEPASLIEA